MLTLFASVLAAWEPETLDRLAGILARLPLPLLRARRHGHAESLAALFPDGLAPGRLPQVSQSKRQSAQAVEKHLLFVCEFLAEMGGRRFQLEDAAATLWASQPPGRGRLLVTLHRGNWIAGSGLLADRLGRLETVAGVQLSPRWQREILGFLKERGVELRGRSEVPDLLSSLRRGGTVVLHLDGDQGSVAASPFGIPMGVRGASVLAARSGAAVFGVICRRLGPGRFRLEAVPLAPDETAGAPLSTQVSIGTRSARAWQAVLLRYLREQISAAPGEWMIFRRPAP